MAGRIRFVCLLHSHQPVGNFDSVIEEAYKVSYLPYVEVFEQFPDIPLTNHYSGCLLEWLDAKHPEYLDRLAQHCKKDDARWEMIGGGFYEPIMTMLPDRDRIGQIRRMQDFIEKRFGAPPRGLWLPERVWEPGLVKDLGDAGVEYLTLDDSHFRAAGLEDNQLVGGFVTEDQGRIVRVYPASERLRYLIPYAQPHEIIDYLRSLLPSDGERVVCYADDGEKFGVWPRTYKHCYENGWLRNFLAALSHAQKEGWLVCSTLEDAYEGVEPVGRIFLPENSYREMTEWALPAQRLATYDAAIHSIKADHTLNNDPRVQDVLGLVKGGNWRSFKVKYPEGNRMYAKMMEVSAAVASFSPKQKLAEKARTHLYRGQCNCPYWHGVFGGMYLPHLRSAIYSELIKADKLVDEVNDAPAVYSVERDFDFDGETEVKLANEHLALYLHPHRGGHLYELDLRDIDFNANDTFSRRFEAYHEKVARAVVGSADQAASIHDLVLAKEPGLAELLKYDTYLRESLVDHVSAAPLTVTEMLSGNPPSDLEFRTGHYDLEEAPLGGKSSRSGRKTSAEAVAFLTKQSPWNDTELKITKKISLGSKAQYEIEYTVENVGENPASGSFGVEMNYSLLAGDAHDRYFYHEKSDNAGKLATAEDFGTLSYIGLKDHWLNVALTLRTSTPAQVIVAPVKTVSQSEGGFEAVYQSSSVLLQWPLDLAPGKSFSVELTQETGPAQSKKS
ncbi:MAG TPA: alpha-amylase/4-alpha-glucanotransferase domain-containing protein [Planctomycetota bacterium]|nr:alpha-amylase/4-alpha-glucanotransferase domain-containing protein [Planctomycetota bacterium]